MTPRLRKALGPAYPWLIRAKTSRLLRLTKSVLGAPDYYKAHRRQSGRIGIDITAPIGMGALLAKVLLLHSWFEASGVEGFVRAGSPLYGRPGEDTLARYFDREPWPADLQPLPMLAGEFASWHLVPRHMPLARAADIFARHLKPNEQLAQVVEAARRGVARFDLSIHFRGTDKVLESGQVCHQAMFRSIEAQLGSRGTAASVFMATDDANFAAAVRDRFAGARFISYDLGEVAPGMPRHFSDIAPDQKALEALVNMFLLASAPVCVRTSSFLSSMAALANPDMRTVTINRTIASDTPFPERELLAHEAARSALTPRVLSHA